MRNTHVAARPVYAHLHVVEPITHDANEHVGEQKQDKGDVGQKVQRRSDAACRIGCGIHHVIPSLARHQLRVEGCQTEGKGMQW